MSQRSSLTGGGRGGGATLLHEAMSFLKRCLSHVSWCGCEAALGLRLWWYEWVRCLCLPACMRASAFPLNVCCCVRAGGWRLVCSLCSMGGVLVGGGWPGTGGPGLAAASCNHPAIAIHLCSFTYKHCMCKGACSPPQPSAAGSPASCWHAAGLLLRVFPFLANTPTPHVSHPSTHIHAHKSCTQSHPSNSSLPPAATRGAQSCVRRLARTAGG